MGRRATLSVGLTVMVMVMQGCGGSEKPSGSRQQPVSKVPARVRADVAETIRKQTHGVAAVALCNPPTQRQAQCRVRVGYANRPDHAYGVAIQGTSDWSEYSVVTSWDAGAVRQP